MLPLLWNEHFLQNEVDAYRPLFDAVDPIQHYYLVRDSLALGSSAALQAPMGRAFPPTVALRSLVLKKKVPLILEWPHGLMPPLAIQCQLALLLALNGEKGLAEKLAEKLTPIVLGRFWTLWALENEYDEEETKLSCALFLHAIGRHDDANLLYSPSLPNTPFFRYLYNSGVQISAAIMPIPTIAWTLEGSKAGMGAIRMGKLNILAFGPHGHPLTNAQLFGISEAGTEWCAASAQKEVWFQIEPTPSGFSLHALGVSFEKPIAFVFYVKAEKCQIGDRTFQPKSLHRFSGEAARVQFDGSVIEADRALKTELIPLSGGKNFWGADFLLAFWLSPLMNKIFFRIENH